MHSLRVFLAAAAALPLFTAAIPALAAPQQASPWLNKYEPNAESRKFPTGSAAERRARMHAAAYSHDPGGIGYIRFHEDLPKTVKVLAIAKSPGGPFIPLTIDSERDRTYPLWGQQSFWVEAKPGKPLDPKLYEFIRFVLSRQGQELVQRDGKYLPLTAKIAAGQMSRLDALEAGRSINGKSAGAN